MLNERYRDRNKDPKYTGKTTQDNLIYLRDTFSDTIPDHIIHSSDKDHRYKVRINWWYGLIENCQNILDFETPDENLQTMLDSFIRKYSTDLKPGVLINDQQIQEANSLINRLVEGVDSDPMLWTADRPYKINWA